ncbi:MAG: hypothetical protein Q8L47_02205 [bacterium]|nr:hypothetical protein [bacterium]
MEKTIEIMGASNMSEPNINIKIIRLSPEFYGNGVTSSIRSMAVEEAQSLEKILRENSRPVYDALKKLMNSKKKNKKVE